VSTFTPSEHRHHYPHTAIAPLDILIDVTLHAVNAVNPQNLQSGGGLRGENRVWFVKAAEYHPDVSFEVNRWTRQLVTRYRLLELQGYSSHFHDPDPPTLSLFSSFECSCYLHHMVHYPPKCFSRFLLSYQRFCRIVVSGVTLMQQPLVALVNAKLQTLDIAVTLHTQTERVSHLGYQDLTQVATVYWAPASLPESKVEEDPPTRFKTPFHLTPQLTITAILLLGGNAPI
jgi:hypothetical protein